jgi:hypothetical protein
VVEGSSPSGGAEKKEVNFTSFFIVFNVLNNIVLRCFSVAFFSVYHKIFFASLKISCIFAPTKRKEVTGQISNFFVF